MLRSLLIGLLLLLTSAVFASAQMVRGTVTDAVTGAPVNATNVSLFTTEGRRVGKMVTFEDGKFELVLPKGKTVYVQAGRIGYETVKSNPISATTSELLELNVRLSAVAIPLQGVEVVSRRQVEPRLREFLDRASLYKRAGIGHIFTRKDLERRPLGLTSQLLNWVHERPVMNCAGLSLFIDDFPVDPEDMDLLVAPEELEGVEIYRDTDVPPDLLYKSRLTVGRISDPLTPPCLMVMLWRKPYAELNAVYAGHPIKKWRVVAGAVVLGALIAAEQVLVGGGR